MAQDPDRLYDKTSLKIQRYDGVHRDYAAHFFRWGFISARMVRRDSRILDIGCGVEMSLARVLSAQIQLVPASYLGVDLNAIRRPLPYKWCSHLAGFNFSERWRSLTGPFDLITCLEVVEHMRMPAVMKLLKGAAALLAPGGRFVLSTPVANGRPAKNHINELTVAQLAGALKKTGWEVERRFGTFASYNEIKKVMSPAELDIDARLREYYGGEVMACFLAPLHPDASRNNVWVCRLNDNEDLLR